MIQLSSFTVFDPLINPFARHIAMYTMFPCLGTEAQENTSRLPPPHITPRLIVHSVLQLQGEGREAKQMFGYGWLRFLPVREKAVRCSIGNSLEQTIGGLYWCYVNNRDRTGGSCYMGSMC